MLDDNSPDSAHRHASGEGKAQSYAIASKCARICTLVRHFSIGLLFLAALADAGVAQQNEQPPLNGVIYGVVIGHDGEPAKGLALAARPLGVGERVGFCGLGRTTLVNIVSRSCRAGANISSMLRTKRLGIRVSARDQ